MTKSVCTIILFSLNFLVFSLNAQAETRGIAILDLSIRNNESNNARLFSVEHMLKVAGIHYVVTKDLTEASNYAMIFCSSFLAASTFSAEEKTALIEFVENGGTLLAPRVQDEDLFPLFGISGYESDFARFEINWNATSNLEALEWIDQPEESTVSLGRSTYDEIYKTLAYTTSSAETLASYKDESSAVTRNAYGNGHAIAIGLSLKEVILRNQINRDYEAQRITSNGFEPTSDVFSLFVRGLYTEHHPYAVWKHTSPGHSVATVMITHDVDSGTGMDTLKVFVDYEAEEHIEATYNITLRYFDDELMSDFYINRQGTMDYIKSKGQAFGSHSVGHFFDFADEAIFPVGEPGNTKANYAPYNDGNITVGGTVYAECEVSKDELESDLNIPINTFRAGHLAFPKYLINVLHELGYEYNSTVSSSDVLTSFPFQNKMGRSFSGDVSNVYEIPVTISDVFHDDPITNTNYLDKAATWLDVTLKNRANGAPTVLLIHPNRNYKLDGMIYYLNQLPGDVHVMEMNLYGDFWVARGVFDFETELQGDLLNVVVANNTDLDDNISFVVNDGQSLASIIVKDEQDQILNFEQEEWGDNDILLYYTGVLSHTEKVNIETAALNVYPSPSHGLLNVEFELTQNGKIQVDLFDLHGGLVTQLMDKKLMKGAQRLSVDLSSQKIAQGIYFVVLRTENGGVERRKVFLM